MKRVTKLLSVLAAGAMFMSALTGCGGGSKGADGDTLRYVYERGGPRKISCD